MAKKLTAPAVEKFKPDPGKRLEKPDGVVDGLFLLIQSSGAKGWAFRYRFPVGGKVKTHKITIGSYPALGLADAREEAGKLRRAVETGNNPKHIQAQERADARERALNTFGMVAVAFTVRYAKRQTRSWKQTKGILRKHVVPAWKDRPVDSITRRDVIELLEGIVRSGKPVLANRVLAHVRKLFAWAIERGIVDASPAVQIKAPGGKEFPRDRDLSDTEIKILWPAFEAAGYPFGPMMQILLLTGQRRTEVATMRWVDLDTDAAVWNLPAGSTKVLRSHSIPLSNMAVEILGDLPRFDGAHVFSTTGGNRPVSGYSKAKLRIEQEINKALAKDGGEPLTNWQIHDLRHTAASGMAKLGVPIDHIGRVLNHAPRGITATVYDRHTYMPEKRRALDLWCVHLRSLVRPEPSNVVPMRGAS